MSKVQVKTITITRAEGLASECDKPETATSWAHANAILFKWSRTAPRTGGYDKCDFKIVFDDGREYEGRYDLQHFSVEHPNLSRHVKSFVSFLAGELPSWVVTKEDEARVRRRQKSLGEETLRDAQKFLEDVDFDGKPVSHY
jgi:hypothetical protein